MGLTRQGRQARRWQGLAVGEEVGEAVGEAVGESVGDEVGDAVGDAVGVGLGEAVGETVDDGLGEGLVAVPANSDVIVLCHSGCPDMQSVSDPPWQPHE